MPYLYKNKLPIFDVRDRKSQAICSYLTLYHTIPTFNKPEKKPFENIVGKGENAGN